MSSPTATPDSTDRPAPSISTSPSWAWPRLRKIPATGWSASDGGIFSYGQAGSLTAPPGPCVSTNRSWAWRPRHFRANGSPVGGRPTAGIYRRSWSTPGSTSSRPGPCTWQTNRSAVDGHRCLQADGYWVGPRPTAASSPSATPDCYGSTGGLGPQPMPTCAWLPRGPRRDGARPVAAELAASSPSATPGSTAPPEAPISDPAHRGHGRHQRGPMPLLAARRRRDPPSATCPRLCWAVRRQPRSSPSLGCRPATSQRLHGIAAHDLDAHGYWVGQARRARCDPRRSVTCAVDYGSGTALLTPSCACLVITDGARLVDHGRSRPSGTPFPVVAPITTHPSGSADQHRVVPGY